MLKSWKSPFRPFQGPLSRRDDESDEQSGSSIERLRNVMAELKVGDAEYDARNGALSPDDDARLPANAPAAQTKAGNASPVPSAAVLAAAKTWVQSPPPVPVAKPVAPAAPVVAAASATAQAASDPAATPVSEMMSAAQQLVAEQRKAAEALLLEAYVLEERLKSEAVSAQASETYAAAKAKADAATAAEAEAKELARLAAELRTAAANERRDAENQAVTARGEIKAAKSKIAELEQQLRDAKQVFEQTLQMVALRESRIKECTTKEAAAKRDAADTTQHVVACENARIAAVKDADAARTQLDGLKSESSQDLAGINDVRALAARIAKQASALRRGPNGVVPSEAPQQAAS